MKQDICAFYNIWIIEYETCINLWDWGLDGGLINDFEHPTRLFLLSRKYYKKIYGKDFVKRDKTHFSNLYILRVNLIIFGYEDTLFPTNK